MNNKLQFKVKHDVSDLICFIEKNNLDNFKKLIENFPDLLDQTKFDDNEPIFYAIRYNNFKIFKYIFEKTKKIYDLGKLLNYICEFGNAKMLRFIINAYKVNINECQHLFFEFFRFIVHFILIIYKLDCVDYLLNESNLNYSYLIPKRVYDASRYNLPLNPENNNTNNNLIKIEINQQDMSDSNPNQINLNDVRSLVNTDITFDLIFIRYKKIFFVQKYSTKSLNFNILELLRY